MIPKIHLKEKVYKVYKTGLPFYDAARLIGVAHMFFGTASAEIVDKGAYWEVKGVDVEKDEEQIEWIIEREKIKSHNFNQKIEQIKRSLRNTYQKLGNNQNLDFDGYQTHKNGYPALVEFDAALSRGVRGVDPSSDYKLLVSVSTKYNPKKKKYWIKDEDLATASIGFCFSASAQSGGWRTFILPVFEFKEEKPIIISGFLSYNKSFRHAAGQQVSNVMAAISILLDLIAQKIPVTDFAYTSVYGQNIILKSGYLGFEKLCSLWWKAITEKNEEKREKKLKVLGQIKSFFENTSSQNIDSQNQELSRHLANFIVNLDVDSLCMVERLKARILASQYNVYFALKLFENSKDIKEVKEMIDLELPDIPWEVSEALAKALELDEKGWMNQFTHLENTTNFSQFIGYVERIISRGYYRELQKKGHPNIRNAMNWARELASSLKRLSENLTNERIFRAWKSIFLMDVLSKMKFKVGGGE